MKLSLVLLFACLGLCLAQSNFRSDLGRKELLINKESSEVTVMASPTENSNLTNRFMLKFSLAEYPTWTLTAFEGSDLPPNSESAEESKLFEFNFLLRRLVVLKEAEESSEESGEEATEEDSNVVASTDKVCFAPDSRILAQLNMKSIQGLWGDIQESSEDAEGSDGNPVKVYTFSSEISMPFGGSAMIKTHLAEAPVRFQDVLIGPGRCKIDLMLTNINVPSFVDNLIDNTTKIALLSVLRAAQPVDEFSLGEENRKSLVYDGKGEVDWFDLVVTEEESGQVDSVTVGKYEWIIRDEQQSEEGSEESSEEASEESIYGVAYCFTPQQKETTVRNFTWGPYLEIYDSEEVSIELEESSEEGSEGSQP